MRLSLAALIVTMVPAAESLLPLFLRHLQLVGVGEMDFMPLQTWPLENLTEEAVIILKNCELSSLMDGVDTASSAISESDPSGALPLVMDGYSYLQRVARSTCSDAERGSFASALTHFEACAGFDLLAFIEELPSALVGAWMECLLSFLAEYDPLIVVNPWENVPERCVNHLYGPHSFGNLARQVSLYPDKMRSCFAVLSEDLPGCLYDAWPIPVIGDWVKKASCVITSSQLLHEDVCEVELRNFLKCIPEDFSGENDCMASTQACALESVYLGLPKPLLGAPLSDTCERVANERSLSVAVARYKVFQGRCTTEWNGWNAKDQDPTSAQLLVASKNPTGGGSSSTWNVLAVFFGGVAVGFFIVALMVGVRGRRKVYTQVSSTETEMITSRKSDERNVV